MRRFIINAVFFVFLILCFFPLTAQEKENNSDGQQLQAQTAQNQSNQSAKLNQQQNGQTVLYTPEQQKLRIKALDVRLVPEKAENGGGYHLFIKKRPGIESILLTETTKDPAGKSDNYAYRAKEYNPINGDEIRYLNGQPLVSEGAKYSLLDSTAEPDEKFGEAFHIYIPQTLVYGYEWSRHGEIEIGKGTFINIRSFEKPYADYTGAFMDSPFMFDLERRVKPKQKTPASKKQKETPKPQKKKEEPKPAPQEKKPPIQIPDNLDEPEVFEEHEEIIPPAEPVQEPEKEEPEQTPEPEPEEIPLPEEEKKEEDPEEYEEEPILTDRYNPIAHDKLKEISSELNYSRGPETIVEDIMDIISKISPKDDLDLVLAIDATGSMKDDLERLKKDLKVQIEKILGEFNTIQVGLLFYRDYGDSFKYNGLPVRFFAFTRNLEVFNNNLNSIRIYGTEGGDIPEAVYEAIYASAAYYKWRPDAVKQIILIGDAEPHPTPRGSGKYSRDYVMSLVNLKGIRLNTILLPDEK